MLMTLKVEEGSQALGNTGGLRKLKKARRRTGLSLGVSRKATALLTPDLS